MGTNDIFVVEVLCPDLEGIRFTCGDPVPELYQLHSSF
jgi:hypothetical protein